MFLPKRYFKTNHPIKKNYKFINFFNNYALKNYKWIQIECVCKNSNDELISSTDRYGVKFDLVICNSCGLIRAKEHLDQKSIIDFYKNHYADVMSKTIKSPEDFYNLQKDVAKTKWKILENFIEHTIDNNFIILDYGGAAGGTLDKYLGKANLYVADYNLSHINFARSKGINTVNGGLKEVIKSKLKPNLIIMSHVVEHWTNFNIEVNDLIKICRDKTIIYIEFPSIDSTGDFLADIHLPHNYYFSSNVFVNLMARYGFECLYHNNEFIGLFRYSKKRKELINYSSNVKKILLLREKNFNHSKKKQVFLKSIIKVVKFIVPQYIINIIKKIYRL